MPGGEASASSQAESGGPRAEPQRCAVPVPRRDREGGRGRIADGAAALDSIERKMAGTAGVRDVVPLAVAAARTGRPIQSQCLGSRPPGASTDQSMSRSDCSTTKDMARGGQPGLPRRLRRPPGGTRRRSRVAISLRAEQVGVPIVFVVLLLTFGSLWATLVPLAIGLTALLGGLGAAGALAFGSSLLRVRDQCGDDGRVWRSRLTTRCSWSSGSASQCCGGMEIDDAIRAAMRTTGVAIAWSGLTVMVAEATMLLVDSRAIRTAGLGMILVTFAAIVAALAGAPDRHPSAGHRILRRSDRERLDAMGTSAATAAAEGADRFTARPRGFWASWGLRVTNRPILWLAGGTVLIDRHCPCPLSSRVKRVDLPSASAMPANSQVRHAAEIGEKSYGPGVFTPVEVVVYATPEMVAHRGQPSGRCAERRSRRPIGPADAAGSSGRLPIEHRDHTRFSR